MGMRAASILVGKCYRTPEAEIREVAAIENGRVTYMSVSQAGGPGILARVPNKHLPLEIFASEVDGEVS